MTPLELLAPAKDKTVGIAAIDCGADAVYIAGPSWGNRKAAGNSMEDIRELCAYARKFGVRIYLTVNTLIRDDEWDDVHAMMLEAQEAGVSAFIFREEKLLTFSDIHVPMHASTQCSILSVERARELDSLGASRLILERGLSLDDVRRIRDAVGCELEFFVHGALCVCYSGECRLSEYLDGRSADRGECIQACRSLYDLEDADGRVLVRDKALLSLRDFKLLGRLGELADAGICSFKIEGRLKNTSYVQNTVRHYSIALDDFIRNNPGYCRASAGRVEGGFSPNLEATFNRGFTNLCIKGTRGSWLSGNSTRSKGEYAGRITAIGRSSITLDGTLAINNGDGLCTVSANGEQTGFRADRCNGNTIEIKSVEGLRKGQEIYRNYNIAFERELQGNRPVRLMDVMVDFSASCITAVSAAGASVTLDIREDFPPARNIASSVDNIRRQLGKRAGIYSFHVMSVDDSDVRFYPLSALNGFRRELALMLDKQMAAIMAAGRWAESPAKAAIPPQKRDATDGVLMKSRYCVKYELGLCSKFGRRSDARLLNDSFIEPLFLVNNGRRLQLAFDCKACEMSVLQCR